MSNLMLKKKVIEEIIVHKRYPTSKHQHKNNQTLESKGNNDPSASFPQRSSNLVNPFQTNLINVKSKEKVKKQ